MPSTREMINKFKVFYKSLGAIYCPSLKINIAFDRHGYHHVLFDGHDHRREDQNIRRRIHLFRVAPMVIKKGIIGKPKEEKETMTRAGPISASYCEICLDCYPGKFREKITVVVRKFPEGAYHYYSIRGRMRQKTKKP